MAIDLTIRGIKRTVDNIKNISRVLKNNMRSANLGAILVIDRWVQRNFAASGRLHEDNKYGPWKPLAESTIRRRRNRSSAILQDTSRLKNSFTYLADNKGASLQNRVFYAGHHEDGFKRIPQRKMLPTEAQAEKLVKPVYEKFIEKAIGDA